MDIFWVAVFSFVVLEITFGYTRKDEVICLEIKVESNTVK